MSDSAVGMANVWGLSIINDRASRTTEAGAFLNLLLFCCYFLLMQVSQLNTTMWSDRDIALALLGSTRYALGKRTAI